MCGPIYNIWRVLRWYFLESFKFFPRGFFPQVPLEHTTFKFWVGSSSQYSGSNLQPYVYEEYAPPLRVCGRLATGSPKAEEQSEHHEGSEHDEGSTANGDPDQKDGEKDTLNRIEQWSLPALAKSEWPWEIHSWP